MATTITDLQVTDSGVASMPIINANFNSLNENKAEIESLAATITLYPTSAAGDFSYNRMVTDITDTDYDDPAVDISTGAITGADQLLAGLIADAGLFIGNPGVINITTLGNIKKVSGTANATFYFEFYKRDSGGTETLLFTSSTTEVVTSSTYEQFNASGLLSNEDFISTDRIVIKYYGSPSGGGTDPIYNFQFGGGSPVRTFLPVPSGAIAHNTLANIEDAGVGVSKGHITAGAQTIAGIKTFSSFPEVSGTPSSNNQLVNKQYLKESFIVACSDETTALTTGAAKVTFRMPYAFTLSEVRASVTTAPTGSVLTADINESGTTILSTKLTIDAGEKTSETAATPPVISDTSLADDAEITIDIDTIGSTVAGAGLKVTLIGNRT